MAPKTTMKAALKRDVPAEPKILREIPPKPRGEASATRIDPFAAAVVKSAETGAPVEIRPGYKMVRAREVLPHVSIYLHPKVIARIKEIADIERVRAHAIYLRALDQYLRTQGVSLDELSRD